MGRRLFFPPLVCFQTQNADWFYFWPFHSLQKRLTEGTSFTPEVTQLSYCVTGQGLFKHRGEDFLLSVDHQLFSGIRGG